MKPSDTVATLRDLAGRHLIGRNPRLPVNLETVRDVSSDDLSYGNKKSGILAVETTNQSDCGPTQGQNKDHSFLG